jgi:putative DNA methylase
VDERFDVPLANSLAAYESYNKHLYRPNAYLHKWWARRCGSTFRLILKGLVNGASGDYYAPGGLEGKIVLDPMMGGGTTLHEAIRLGANAIGVDIDPIPVLQARATLSAIPLAELETAFEDLHAALYSRLAHLYRTTCPECGCPVDLNYVLYGARRFCRCGPVLSVDSTILRQNADGSTIRICAKCHHIGRGEQDCACAPSVSNTPLVEKGTGTCPTCGEAYREDLTIPFYARYAPLAIVGQCPSHGVFFAEPRSDDLRNLQLADELRDGAQLGPLEDFAVYPGPKSQDLIRHGIRSYLDLFSSRQILYLERAIQLLPRFAPSIRLNLGLLISTSLEFNSMLCGYKGSDKRRPGAVRHTFSHHAYSFPHTALENNPILNALASGTLRNLFHDRIWRARHWAMRPEERAIVGDDVRKVVITGEVDFGFETDNPKDLASGDHRFLLTQGSAGALHLGAESVDYVVTDPPYFDSVQYSDLATYFRVWLRRLLPTDAVWDYDQGESAVDPDGNGNGQYTKVLSSILAECHRVLKKKSGRLIFTFHHWNPKGWAALTLALMRSNFVLLNRFVVHSENPTSTHIVNVKALTHDAVLVLAPIEAGLARQWVLPSRVDAASSRQFCEDCATVIGWMLNCDLTESDVEAEWKRLLS